MHQTFVPALCVLKRLIGAEMSFCVCLNRMLRFMQWCFAWMFIASISVALAQTKENSAPLAGESFLSRAMQGAEITYGMNKTNLSIVHGVLVNAKLDPTLDFNLEREDGFLSIEHGLGLWLMKETGLKSGVSVNYLLGRFQANDLAYRGLGDVNGQFEAYAFAEWQPVLEAVTLYANWGATPGSQHKGLAQVGFTLGLPLGQGWDVFWDCKEAYGDQAYLQAYYGVNAQQAQLSGKSIFLPTTGSALYNTQNIGLVYEFNPKLSLIVGVGFIKASNALMQSPLLNGLQLQRTSLAVANQNF